jgi:hypothetical protein
LITGFEDNTFRPNAAVTRAQLAALLDRTNDQIVGNDAVKGSVTAVVYNNTLAIKSGNVAQTVVLDPNVFVYRGGVKVAPTALVIGDDVKIHLYNNVAIFVEVVKLASATPVTPVPTDFTINGWYLSHTLNVNGDGKVATITILQSVGSSSTLQSTTYVIPSNVSVDITKLLLNHAIQLKGVNTTITQIIIQ